jgi:5-hydroxyisourate hydrolase
MSLSTHILDTTLGRPASGVEMLFETLRGSTWMPLSRGVTDNDGRCKTLLGQDPLEQATYRIRFHTGPYFIAMNIVPLYPYIDIVFTVADPSQHYHIPLLLTANGYTTYRGT